MLKEQAYLNAGTSFIWSCAPFMVNMRLRMVKVVLGIRPRKQCKPFVSADNQIWPLIFRFIKGGPSDVCDLYLFRR